MRPDLEQALRTSYAVAQKLRARREALRQALENSDTEAVIRCARQLLGMDDDEAEGHRPPPRLQRSPGGS